MTNEYLKKSWFVEKWIGFEVSDLLLIFVVIESIETILAEEERVLWKAFIVECHPFGGI